MRHRAANGNVLPSTTESADSYHITRAVAPRGSRLLASVDKNLYNKTLPAQTQCTEACNLPAYRLLRCHSLGPSYRKVKEKLPFLPTTIRNPSAYRGDVEEKTAADGRKRSDRMTEPAGYPNSTVYADGNTVSPLLGHDIDSNYQPSYEIYDDQSPTASSNAPFQDPKMRIRAIHPIKISASQRCRDQGQRLHVTNQRYYHGQFTSTQVDDSTCHLFPEIGDGWAHRCTEHKDSKPRYQSKSLDLDLPPPPPLHQSTKRKYARYNTAAVSKRPTSFRLCHDSHGGSRLHRLLSHRLLRRQQTAVDVVSIPGCKDLCYRDRDLQAPRPPPIPPHQSLGDRCTKSYTRSSTTDKFLYPCNDSKCGPRPPPWGSIETLEVARRERGDARKRADTVALRGRQKIAPSRDLQSALGQSAGTSHLRKEIEAYREQVLRVYPDMKFDGEAGKGGRECWCVVM